MKRSKSETYVVDRGRVKGRHVKVDGIVIYTGDTGNVCRGSAGFNTLFIFRAESGDGELQTGGSGCLGLFRFFYRIISSNDGIPEILRCRVFRKLEAPVRRTCGNRIAGRIVAVGDAVVDDFLREISAGFIVVIIPESVVLFFCIAVILRISIRTCRENSIAAGIHAASVLFHAFDRKRIDRRRSVISRVNKYIE